MDNQIQEIDEYRGKEFEESAYRYLKAKYDHDPESLSEMEGGLLLLFNASRYLSLRERSNKYIEFYQKAYERALQLVDSYAAGTYKGKDITRDFYLTLPSETDQFVRVLGEIDLLVKINELNHRFMEITLKKEPLPESNPTSHHQLVAIDEERQALIAAGFPADKIEAEARRRGTFKAAFGEHNLPPIKVK